MTELLWLDSPHTRAANARVVARRSSSFIADKSLFSPGLSEYRHPQPPDRGDVWVGGDKRSLRRVSWSRGELLHTLSGVTPEIGSSLRMHLDVSRREAIEDAHLAMHLVLSAIARQRKMVLTDACHVQGGRFFALVVRRDTFSPDHAAEIVSTANAATSKNLVTRIEYVTREALHDVDAQAFEDGERHPGGDGPLRVIKIGDASSLPCDGTLRAKTSGLGRVVLKATRGDRRGLLLQFQVI